MGKKKKHYKPNNKTMMDFALEYIHTRITNDLPYMYSAVALALWNVLDETDEEKEEDIKVIIDESMRVWNDIVENGKDILEECERITGFCMKEEVC